MDRTPSLLHRWRQFVADVRVGYELTIYDYTNELAVRDSLTREMRSRPSDELNVFDTAFRETTREATHALPGAPDEPAWWWNRVPINVHGELGDDLKAEGLR